MYIRVVASLLVVVGTTIAVELALLARLAVRQSATLVAPAGAVESTVVPPTALPDDSDAVLDRMVHRVEIPKMALIQALDELSAQSGVTITVQGMTLRELTDHDIEAHLSDVSLRDALTVVLRQVKPVPPFCTDSQVVIVGAETMETRLYDLRPLMPQNATGTSSGNLSRLNNLSSALVDAIRSTSVSEELWHRNGDMRSITQWDGVLVVHETPHYHRFLSRLLNQLAITHSTVPVPPTWKDKPQPNPG